MKGYNDPASAGGGLGSTLSVDSATVRFDIRRSSLMHRGAVTLTAVDSVSIRLAPGQSLGVVGESGSGKSTLARAVAGLVPLTSGSMRLGDIELGVKRDRALARRMQMVFQDPASSLNPRLSVRTMLREILSVHEMVPKKQLDHRMAELVEMVDLPLAVLDRRPRSLSGGQRQRLGIARALALQPELLILDEAIAALDVSVQASVLELITRLQASLGFAMIFISHDLGAVRRVCERVAVMYLGRVIEEGPVDRVLRAPEHPYTRALISAEPSIDHPKEPGSAGVKGEPPSPIDLPVGCSFRQRCPIARDICGSEFPPLVAHSAAERDAYHRAACYFPGESESDR